MSTTYPPIEIASPGKRRALNGAEFEFTPAILAELAEYDPAVFEAPIVLGHPKLDDPAFGWLGSASIDPASGKLTGVPSTLAPEFAEAVQARRYSKISPAIYLPDSPNNPRPGKHTLKHIGFFGAHAVADKGLRPYQFAADEAGVLAFGDWEDGMVATLFRNVREWLLTQFGPDTADKVVPGHAVDFLQQSAAQEQCCDDQPPSDGLQAFAQTQARPRAKATMSAATQPANFAEREAAIARREAELNAKEHAAEQRRCLDFAEKLSEEGRLLPRDKAGFAAFMASIPSAGAAPLEFGEGDAAQSIAPSAWFEAFAKALPKRVDFGEFDPVADGEAAPPSDQEIARRARAYKADQEGKGIYLSFAEAVDGVAKNLDLKQ